MSFSTPRTNIIAIMESIEFVQVKDAFDFENVASTNIEKGFHLEQGTITPEAVNMQTTAVSNTMTLRFWEKARRNTADAVTDHLIQLDTIMNNILDISNKTNNVRNILFDEFTPVPHSEKNDDIIRGELTLTINQEFCFIAP